MQIRIAGYLPASFLLEREPDQWHALVLLDSGKQPTDFVKSHARSFCYLHFDDVEEPRAGKLPPSKALIEQALLFARDKDNLLVSCRAGQGHSAALAYVISSQAHGAATAIQLLNPTRHRPNRLIVTLADSLVAAPDMLQHFEDWRQRHAHIRLADHYDDIEKEFDDLEAQGACNKICG